MIQPTYYGDFFSKKKKGWYDRERLESSQKVEIDLYWKYIIVEGGE